MNLYISSVLISINIITFAVYNIDKGKARWGKRRVPEKILWTLAILGGSPGALLAMHMFRHKTQKISFQAILSIILALQLLLFYIVFRNRIALF
jgi:uncharacterized membrane protein YsdA (DUF1294 family)